MKSRNPASARLVGQFPRDRFHLALGPIQGHDQRFQAIPHLVRRRPQLGEFRAPHDVGVEEPPARRPDELDPVVPVPIDHLTDDVGHGRGPRDGLETERRRHLPFSAEPRCLATECWFGFKHSGLSAPGRNMGNHSTTRPANRSRIGFESCSTRMRSILEGPTPSASSTQYHPPQPSAHESGLNGHPPCFSGTKPLSQWPSSTGTHRTSETTRFSISPAPAWSPGVSPREAH